MLLTPMMAGAGVLVGLCQWIAHQLAYTQGAPKRWATNLVRYAIGVSLALVAFSIAYALDERQNAIIAIWYVFGASGVATWIAHAGDPAPARMPALNDAMLEKFAQAIVDEHDESK